MPNNALEKQTGVDDTVTLTDVRYKNPRKGFHVSWDIMVEQLTKEILIIL